MNLAKLCDNFTSNQKGAFSTILKKIDAEELKNIIENRNFTYKSISNYELEDLKGFINKIETKFIFQFIENITKDRYKEKKELNSYSKFILHLANTNFKYLIFIINFIYIISFDLFIYFILFLFVSFNFFYFN